MPVFFKVFSTASFKKKLKKLYKKDKNVIDFYEHALKILENNPFADKNIKKLIDVKQNDGQWRIRLGDYRFRYDVFGKKVVLHSVKNRKDAYK